MAENDTSEAPEAEKSKPSKMPLIITTGFVALVVIVETLIFFFMVPSADDVAALAEARLIKKVEESMQEDGEETLTDEDELQEFQMGQYGYVFTPPGSDREQRVEFNIYGLVKEPDQSTLEALFNERQGRLRDRMLEEVRNATMNELEQLGLIKRRISAISNEILEHKPTLLQGIGFNNFTVMAE
ncbi:dihydrolipoamide acetyltransferase [Aureliella helgolandensis]|uniref:Flagellar protein FliL n=1 Tax=Aureliella helgolandensis TaxID=2527968 RepID=A0A518GGL7_9BACT|nr:dihydrolipoamide acetyltransferase [Aureliella helgolandensis]QDV27736.1 hypothetical protein Q31a_61290 [Aureliella helgolandensis]